MRVGRDCQTSAPFKVLNILDFMPLVKNIVYPIVMRNRKSFFTTLLKHNSSFYIGEVMISVIRAFVDLGI